MNLNWIGDGSRWLDWLKARLFAMTIGLAAPASWPSSSSTAGSSASAAMGSLFLALAAVVPSFLGFWLTALLQQSSGSPTAS